MRYDIENALRKISDDLKNQQTIDLQNELTDQISDQIEKVLLDSTGMSDIDDYHYIENDPEPSDENIVFISDSSFDIGGQVFSGLTDEEIKSVAEEAYQTQQQRNNSTTLNGGTGNNYYTAPRANTSIASSESSNTTNKSYNSKAYESVSGWFKTGYTKSRNFLRDNGVLDIIKAGANQGINAAGTAFNEAVDFIKDFFGDATTFAETEASKLISYLNDPDLGSTSFGKALKSIIESIGLNKVSYQDGVSETTFGDQQEASWQGSTTAFLNYYQQQNRLLRENNYKINFIESPLNSGGTREALYGTFMLGAPFLFNEQSDPTNRAVINTLVKDGKFLSLTPGLPKFNGLSYRQNIYTSGDTIFTQTKSPQQMLEYLQRNGLDSDFSDKDKRYYTFKTDYEDYFAYLETMLNTVWVKMGLSQNGNTFNLFTFFNMKGSGEGVFNPENYKNLKSQYNSSISFFTNPAGAVVESVDNSQTSFNLGAETNSTSDEYQRINYLTGMGTGSNIENTTRLGGIAVKSVSSLLGLVKGNTAITQSLLDSKANAILKLAGTVPALVADYGNFKLNNDLGATLQAFQSSNGMKVQFPELWYDSAYSRSASFNFTFMSPYGDPFSIFKYVYVPFFALLCFAMPRQAAENGLVSPFFVRASIPGMYNADLAMISSISWTKGGAANLWTKDGLPRAIDVSIQVQDLYSYLAMSKRLSFLSANPSYAVFLDQFSGLFSLNDTNSSDALNEYFKNMIDYANGRKNKQLWNKFHSRKTGLIKSSMNQANRSISALVDSTAIPWLHNSVL